MGGHVRHRSEFAAERPTGWRPYCVRAGAKGASCDLVAGAIGPALQSIGVTQGYYFFNAAPYILTLVIMIATSSAKHAAADMPGELSMAK